MFIVELENYGHFGPYKSREEASEIFNKKIEQKSKVNPREVFSWNVIPLKTVLL